MNTKDRVACMWMAAVCVTGLAYLVAPGLPRYYPVEHLWRWETVPGTPGMGWYARAGWALLAGGVGAGVVGVGLRFVSAAMGERVRRGLVLGLFLVYPVAVGVLLLQEFVWKKH